MKIKELINMLNELNQNAVIKVCVTDCGGSIGDFDISSRVDWIEDHYILDIDIGHNHGKKESK